MKQCSVPYQTITKIGDWTDKDTLVIECKDFRTMIFCFSKAGESKRLKADLQKFCGANTSGFFAFMSNERFGVESEIAGWPVYDAAAEFKRQGIEFSDVEKEDKSKKKEKKIKKEKGGKGIGLPKIKKSLVAPKQQKEPVSWADFENEDQLHSFMGGEGDTAAGLAWVLVRNNAFKLISSYPEFFIIPQVSSSVLKSSLDLYYKKRIPVLAWNNPAARNTFLFRSSCSQPDHQTTCKALAIQPPLLMTKTHAALEKVFTTKKESILKTIVSYVGVSFQCGVSRLSDLIPFLFL